MAFPPRDEIWSPIAFSDEDLRQRQTRSHLVIARLKPSLTLGQAQAQMDALSRHMQQQYPKVYPESSGWSISLGSLNEQAVGDVRPALLMLFGAVVTVLLIACANVANLLLARAANQQKEIAIRAALGARRGRIVRQLLTESALPALVGGSLGLGLAVWAVGRLKTLPGDTLDSLLRNQEIGIDGWTLGFTIALSLLVILP